MSGVNWEEHADTTGALGEQLEVIGQLTAEMVALGEQLEVIGQLTAEMVALGDRVVMLEDQLKEAKEAYRKVSEFSLPEAMMSLGLSELKDVSGHRLILEKFYQAKIPDEMKDAAFRYLENTGNDAIIKTDVSAKFGKGEKEEAMKVAELLREHGVMPSVKTDIHHATLRAFVKEQIERGVEGFPQDLFGVYVGNRIKIK